MFPCPNLSFQITGAFLFLLGRRFLGWSGGFEGTLQEGFAINIVEGLQNLELAVLGGFTLIIPRDALQRARVHPLAQLA